MFQMLANVRLERTDRKVRPIGCEFGADTRDAMNLDLPYPGFAAKLLENPVLECERKRSTFPCGVSRGP
jgi:hypothetical protein